MEYLHGDAAVVARVFGEVDRSHPAAAELLLELVAAVEDVGKGRVDRGHASWFPLGREHQGWRSQPCGG